MHEYYFNCFLFVLYCVLSLTNSMFEDHQEQLQSHSENSHRRVLVVVAMNECTEEPGYWNL